MPTIRSPAGFISVGRRDQKTGILVIEDGGVVRTTNANSTGEIGGNAGSTGIVTVTGQGSLLSTGEYLAIGSDYVANGFDGSIGGTGDLTLADNGRAEAGTFYVGAAGVINLGATATGNVILQDGLIAVGGTAGAATGTVDGDLDASGGTIRLELLDFTSGATDMLEVTGTLTAAVGQVVLDASDLARATQGDTVAFLDAATITPGFGLGGVTLVNAPGRGVSLGLTRSGNEFSVNVASAPSKTVGLFGGDVSITEGNPGDDQVVTLTLMRSGDLTTTMDVGYALSGGTADASDFVTAATGTVVFAAGEDTATLEIQLLEDAAVEGDETIDLNLTSVTVGNGTSATILNDSTTITIIDDDQAPATTTNGNVQFGDSYPTLFDVISLDPNGHISGRRRGGCRCYRAADPRSRGAGLQRRRRDLHRLPG